MVEGVQEIRHHQSRDRRGPHSGRRSTAADVDRAVEAARRAFDGQFGPWRQHVRHRTRTADLATRGPDRTEHRRNRRTRDPRQRQADLRIAQCRYANGDRRPPLLRGMGDQDSRRDRQHLRNGLHLHPARAGRRCRPDHSLEFPATACLLEAGPGAGLRKHRRHEACRTDSAHRLAPRGTGARSGISRRSPEHRHGWPGNREGRSSNIRASTRSPSRDRPRSERKSCAAPPTR